MSQSILIVGHGYLGQRLAQSLFETNWQILALTKSSPSEAFPYPVVGCDISAPKALDAIDFQPEFIIHCASSNRGGAEAYEAVFLNGVRNLISRFPEPPIFLTSSTSVYAQVDGSEVTELSPANPDRESGQFLRQAEDYLLEHQGTVLRLAGIYGENRSVHLQKILSGKATIESGETSRFLNQIHVDDCVSAIRHLIYSGKKVRSGQIFNVADSVPLRQRELYEALARYFDLPVPPEAPPDYDRKRAWTNKRVSNNKLCQIGWGMHYPSFLGALDADLKLISSIKNRLSSAP